MKELISVDIPGIEYVLVSSLGEEIEDLISRLRKECVCPEDESYRDFLLECSIKKNTELDQKIISLAIEGVKYYLKEIGIEKEIPSQNLYLLGYDVLSNDCEGTTGIRFDPNFHCGLVSFSEHIFLERSFSDTLFALMVFKGFWEATCSCTAYEVGRSIYYRTGLTFPDKENGRYLFFIIDNFLKNFQGQKFYEEFVKNNPLFSQDIEFYGEGKILEHGIYRQEEREFFFTLVKHFSEAGGMEEKEIITEFLRSQMTGNLKKIRYLCRLAYGKNGFRDLGRETSILL